MRIDKTNYLRGNYFPSQVILWGLLEMGILFQPPENSDFSRGTLKYLGGILIQIGEVAAMRYFAHIFYNV